MLIVYHFTAGTRPPDTRRTRKNVCNRDERTRYKDRDQDPPQRRRQKLRHRLTARENREV